MVIFNSRKNVSTLIMVINIKLYIT